MEAVVLLAKTIPIAANRNARTSTLAGTQVGVEVVDSKAYHHNPPINPVSVSEENNGIHL
ncbi:MAG: hypothetical protein E7D71_05100 [Varibaculum cambriense]|nr:hypothetical protein [Varibaculum cambriense]